MSIINGFLTPRRLLSIWELSFVNYCNIIIALHCIVIWFVDMSLHQDYRTLTSLHNKLYSTLDSQQNELFRELISRVEDIHLVLLWGYVRLREVTLLHEDWG